MVSALNESQNQAACMGHKALYLLKLFINAKTDYVQRHISRKWLIGS